MADRRARRVVLALQSGRCSVSSLSRHSSMHRRCWIPAARWHSHNLSEATAVRCLAERPTMRTRWPRLPSRPSARRGAAALTAAPAKTRSAASRRGARAANAHSARWPQFQQLTQLLLPPAQEAAPMRLRWDIQPSCSTTHRHRLCTKPHPANGQSSGPRHIGQKGRRL